MGKRIDLTGQQFEYWTVNSFAYSKSGHSYWNCSCKCGQSGIVDGSKLRRGLSKSCGCYAKENLGLKLLGQRFDYLVVEKQLPSKNWQTCWLCKCDCGNYCEKYGHDLVSGKATNCGCKSKEKLIEIGKSHFHDLTGQTFGLLYVIKRIDDKIYNDKAYVNYLCRCECGREVEITGSALIAGQISCGCLKRSRGEYQIFSFLQSNNYSFQEQYKIKLNTGENRYFDFALTKDDKVWGLIEFDGQQHFEEILYFNNDLAINQLRDNQKNQWCLDNNIPLLRIHYKDYKNIEKLLINFIKEINYE